MSHSSEWDDAVRFHCCLLWTGDVSARLDERELADTVQTVLVDQLEWWAAGVFRYCAEAGGGFVPLAPSWSGLAGHLVTTAPYQLEELLTPASFAPDRAAGLLAETVAAAASDLSRIRSRGAGRADRHLGCLAAHLELLARLAITVRPLMPGWAAFMSLHLGLTGTQVPPGRLTRPLARTPVLTPGHRISDALPVYFRPLP